MRFSSAISDEEFVPLIPEHLNTGYIAIQQQSGYPCCRQAEEKVVYLLIA